MLRSKVKKSLVNNFNSVKKPINPVQTFRSSSCSAATTKPSQAKDLTAPSTSTGGLTPQPRKNPDAIGKKIYAIILPLILDENKRNMDQPILVSVSASKLDQIGISLTADFFQDETLNLFKTKVKNKEITFRMVAVGGELIKL